MVLFLFLLRYFFSAQQNLMLGITFSSVVLFVHAEFFFITASCRKIRLVLSDDVSHIAKNSRC